MGHRLPDQQPPSILFDRLQPTQAMHIDRDPRDRCRRQPGSMPDLPARRPPARRPRPRCQPEHVHRLRAQQGAKPPEQHRPTDGHGLGAPGTPEQRRPCRQRRRRSIGTFPARDPVADASPEITKTPASSKRSVYGEHARRVAVAGRGGAKVRSLLRRRPRGRPFQRQEDIGDRAKMASRRGRTGRVRRGHPTTPRPSCSSRRTRCCTPWRCEDRAARCRRR